ncbi:MAG: PAS domain S-box protein [Bacteroidales bacterium]
MDDSKRNMSRKIFDILNKGGDITSAFENKSFDEILEEFVVYHQELEYQNEELRRIHAELEDSRNDFAELFDHAPVGYVIFDRSFTIQSVNKVFANLVNLEVKSIIGSKITEYISPDNQDEFYLHFKGKEKFSKEGSINTLLHTTIKKVPVKVDSNIINKNGDILYRSTFIDISSEEGLKAKLHERIKEQNCLIKISKIISDNNLNTDQILQQVVETIPEGFQFPDDLDAQIDINGKIYQTSNFANCSKGDYKHVPIKSYGKKKGGLTVCSCKANQCEKIFLKEEVNLLVAIAKQIEQVVELKQANSLIENKERYYRSLLHGLHEDILVIDQNFTITDVNNNYLKTLGLSRDEVIGKACFEVSHGVNEPCSKQGEKCELKKVFNTGKPSVCIHEHLDANGSKAHIDIILSPLKDKTGRVTHVIEAARDISEIIESKRASKESEGKFRLLISQMHQGLALHEVVKDDKGRVIDYRFLEVNSSFERLTGLKGEDVVGKTVLQVLPKTEKKWIKIYGNVATTGQPVQFENYSKSLGKYFHVDAYSPKPNQFAVIITDITDKKKAESALRFNETRYRSLFENSHAMMLIVNPQSGQIVDTNPAAESFYGWSRQEMRGMNINEINTLTKEEVKREMSLAASEQRRYFVFKHRLKSGEIKDVEVFSGPVDMEGQTLLYSFIHDITEKSIAEKALVVSEEKYRKLAETTKTIFWEFDPEQDKWTYISPQVKTFLGYEDDEWTDFDFWANRIHPEERDKIASFCKNATEKGKNHEMEYRFIKPDGEIVWIREEVTLGMKDGKVKVLRGTMMDITKRKVAELALKASEQKFQALFNNLTVGVSLISPQMELLEVNPKIKEWFPNGEYHKNPFCYCTLSSQNQEKPCEECPALKTLADGGVYETEIYRKTKQGKMYFRVVSTPIFNDKGEVIAAVEMLDNTTKRKLTEIALVESEEKHRTLFETMEQGVIYQDGEGRITSANQAAQRILGLSLEQMQGRESSDPLWQVVKEDGGILQGEEHPAMLALKTGVPIIGVTMGVFHPKEDEYRWILVNAVPEFKNDDEKPFRVYTTFTDITQRKKQEEEIKEQHDFMETLMQTIPNPVFYKDVSGRYIGCNKAFEDFVGSKKDDILGKTVYEMGTLPIAQKYHEMDKKLIRKKGSQHYEWTVKRKDGVVREVLFDKATLHDKKGDVAGIIGVITDITERKKAEEDIKRNARRLKSLVRIFEHKADSIKDLLDFALSEALNLTGSKIGYIYIYDEQKEQFVLNSWSKDVMERCSIVNPDTCYELKNTGIWGEVVRQRKEIIVNDFMAHHPLKKGFPEGHAQLNSFMSIPVMIDDKIVSVIGVGNKEGNYNETDLNQLKLLMGSVWGIVQRKEDSQKISKLSVAVEQSSASVVITDMNGTIEYVNPRFTEITGYSYVEAVGNNPRVLNSGYHDNNFFKILWETILSGNDWRGQIVNRKKNGDLYWESASISPIYNANNEITNFIAIKDDITELKKAEEAVRDSELKLRRMIELSPDGIMLTDENGKIVAWNNALEELSRIPAKEAMKANISDFHKLMPLGENHSNLVRKVERITKELLRTGKSSQFDLNTLQEVKINFGDTIRYIQLMAFVIPGEKGNMLASFARDITQQKMAEIAIKEREEKLQAIFDNSIQSFVILSPDFIVQAYNHVAWERAKFFFNKEFAIGKSILDIYPSEQVNTIKGTAEKALQGDVKTFEVSLTDSANNLFWYELHFSPVFDEKKNVTSIFFNSIDITQRKLAEESMARALEKEKELSELKSRFVSTVSHEFRTPLASIYSNTQLLQRYYDKWNEEKRELSFKRVYESVNIMTGMLENVSLIGKEQSGNLTFRPEVMNLEIFAQQMADESQVTLAVENRINLNVDGDYDRVLLDKVLLRHILVNILTNAIKYSPSETKVDFKIRKVKRYLEFLVQDYGVGIPENELNSIFNPFFRASNSEEFSGTGLGLAIVKQCVNVHGGDMSIDSMLNKGTLVKVWLPLRKL